jgi:hypothetical protein
MLILGQATANVTHMELRQLMRDLQQLTVYYHELGDLTFQFDIIFTSALMKFP